MPCPPGLITSACSAPIAWERMRVAIERTRLWATPGAPIIAGIMRWLALLQQFLRFDSPRRRSGEGALKHVMFYRRFSLLSGSQLKVWEYFNHVKQSPRHVPHVRFSPDSVWSPSNPWYDPAVPLPDAWPHLRPDAYVLNANDWRILEPAARDASPVPVVNLLQSMRAADPAHHLYKFLKHKAVRVCVSPDIADAVRATGAANGPVVHIPMGTDLGGLRAMMTTDKRCPLLIAALKNRDLGTALHARLAAAGQHAELLTDQLSRHDFLARLSRARTVLLLPYAVEGFFLPALEAMALGALVICPDCVGNRSFCLDGVNCLRPAYEGSAVEAAVSEALSLAPDRRQAMLDRAATTADEHSLVGERRAFLELLDALPGLW